MLDTNRVVPGPPFLAAWRGRAITILGIVKFILKLKLNLDRGRFNERSNSTFKELALITA